MSSLQKLTAKNAKDAKAFISKLEVTQLRPNPSFLPPHMGWADELCNIYGEYLCQLRNSYKYYSAYSAVSAVKRPFCSEVMGWFKIC